MDGGTYTWHPTLRDRLVARAHGIVNLAIKRGTLAPLDGLVCVDCGAEAECYDHRNYHEPLKVVPVCKGCNNRRGPGEPFPESGDNGEYKHPFKVTSNTRGWHALEGDAEGYIVSELPVHAEVDWKEMAESVDESPDRLLNASNSRLLRAAGTRRGWVKTARYEYFKARDPWTLADSFEEFA